MSIKQNCGKLLKLALMTVAAMVFSVGAMWAQNSKVTGKVTDKNGEPLVGVYILVQGTKTGATTDVNGKYAITAPANGRLVFSSMGFADNVQAVNNRAVINVVMQDNAVKLSDVVVVGYGSQKKANLTGAVASVDVGKAIDSRPIPDLGRGLQGVTPGLTVTIPSGEVGSDPIMKIRGAVGSVYGNSNPLILLDNVEIPSVSIINPDDVESISVLKDAASASIYGAKAAFGVILITSKKGAKTEKVSVSYSDNFSWENSAYKVNMAGVDGLSYTVDAFQRVGGTIAGAFWYVDAQSLAYAKQWKEQFGGKVGPNDPVVYGRDWYVRQGSNYKMGVRTYQASDYMIKKNAPGRSHNITVNGKSGNTSYNLGLGYVNVSGMMKPAKHDDFTRYNASLNLTTDVNKYLTLNAGLMYSQRNKRYAYITNSTSADPWLYLYRWGPLYPMANDEYGNVLRSPAEEARQAHTANIFNGYININLGATIHVMKNWNINGSYTYSENHNIWNRPGTRYTAGNTWIAPVNATDNQGNALTSTDVWGAYGTAGASIPAKMLYYQTYTADGSNPDHIFRQSAWTKNKSANITSTYHLMLGEDHDFNFMLGFDYNTYDYRSNWSQIAHLLDIRNPQFALADGTQTSGGSVEWNSQVGYFGRVNYSFRNKYLAEFNLRYGATSKFPSDMRWRWFPSGSIGWNFSQEKFMNWAKPYLTSGKIRASYGAIGDQSVDSGMYIASITPNNSAYTLNSGGTKYAYANTPAVVSPALTWQSIKTFDIGVDVRLFDNALGVTFDWYQRTTDNMIVGGTAVPTVFGSGPSYGNFGSLRTRGWELAIDYTHRFASGLGMNVRASLSDYSTTITKYAKGTVKNVGNTWWEGNKYGDIYGYETDRLYNWDDFVLAGDGTRKWANLQKVKLGAQTVTSSEAAQGIIADPNYSRSYGKSQGKVVYMQKNHEKAVYQGGLQSGSLYFGPGDVKYKDLDGDGDIWYGNMVKHEADGDNNSIGDLKRIGNSTPRYEYGLRVALDYKGFDFSIFAQGIGSRKIVPSGFLGVAGYNSSDGAMPQAIANNYWTWDEASESGRTNAYYPRAVNTGSSDPGRSSFNNTIQSKYLLNMAYLRIKNITVGYTLPDKIARKAWLSKARIFFTLENYFTFNHLHGLPIDPEEVSGYSMFNEGNYNMGRTGVGTPTYKSMSFGIQLTFE